MDETKENAHVSQLLGDSRMQWFVLDSSFLTPQSKVFEKERYFPNENRFTISGMSLTFFVLLNRLLILKNQFWLLFILAPRTLPLLNICLYLSPNQQQSMFRMFNNIPLLPHRPYMEAAQISQINLPYSDRFGPINLERFCKIEPSKIGFIAGLAPNKIWRIKPINLCGWYPTTRKLKGNIKSIIPKAFTILNALRSVYQWLSFIYPGNSVKYNIIVFSLIGIPIEIVISTYW